MVLLLENIMDKPAWKERKEIRTPLFDEEEVSILCLLELSVKREKQETGENMIMIKKMEEAVGKLFSSFEDEKVGMEGENRGILDASKYIQVY